MTRGSVNDLVCDGFRETGPAQPVLRPVFDWRVCAEVLRMQGLSHYAPSYVVRPT
jgi:hypothetical protein